MRKIIPPPSDSDGANTHIMPPATTNAPIYCGYEYFAFNKYLDIPMDTGIAACANNINNGPSNEHELLIEPVVKQVNEYLVNMSLKIFA